MHDAVMDPFVRIRSGEFEYEYEHGLNKPSRDMTESEKLAERERRNRNNAKEAERREAVRVMLADFCEVQGHKHEPLLWSLAWQHGHSSGYHEVANYYVEFAELLK